MTRTAPLTRPPLWHVTYRLAGGTRLTAIVNGDTLADALDTVRGLYPGADPIAAHRWPRTRTA